MTRVCHVGRSKTFITVQIFSAHKPDPSYFFDDNQSPLKDILKGLTRNGTSIGTVGGPDFINYAPCFIRSSAQNARFQK